ncbi:hypothetical protein L7F22_033251 [Adiantum nelumboides]|nr:hypothetical protein [Adiantum nelumboides]
MANIHLLGGNSGALSARRACKCRFPCPVLSPPPQPDRFLGRVYHRVSELNSGDRDSQPSDKLHSFIDGLEPNLKDGVHTFNPVTLDAAIAYVERLCDNRRPTINFFLSERSFNNTRSFQRDNRLRYSQNERSSQNFQVARQYSCGQSYGQPSSRQQAFWPRFLGQATTSQDPLPVVFGIEEDLDQIGNEMTAIIFNEIHLENTLLHQHLSSLSLFDQDYALFVLALTSDTEQCSSSNTDKGKQAVRAMTVSKVITALMLNVNNHISVPINLLNQVLNLLGFVSKHPLNVLVDSGCSTNFVSTTLVSKLRLPTHQSFEAFQVELADGSFLQSNKKVQQLQFQIQNYRDQLNFSLMPLSHYDMILGQSWLYQYDPIISFRDHSIRLYHNNQELKLRGLFNTKLITMVYAMQVKRLAQKPLITLWMRKVFGGAAPGTMVLCESEVPYKSYVFCKNTLKIATA